MCIYLVDQPDLHYDSAEHIIPAGIGGIKKLPNDYVSQEFNNLISKHERAFMQNSVLAIPRQLLGPGKRGSLQPSKATKSSVYVHQQAPEGNGFSFGYIQAGKPFDIPHIVWDSASGEYTMGMDKSVTEADVVAFKQLLVSFDEAKVKRVQHQQLDATTFILGAKVGLEYNIDFYVASQDGVAQPFTAALLAEFNKRILDKSTFFNSKKYHISTHQTATIDNNFYRCCAKIAFNTLAHLKEKDFVLQECFNPLRRWIAQDGENNFVRIISKHNSELQDFFPLDSHRVFITKVAGALIAEVCLYDGFHTTVYLADNFSGPFTLEGFICDWRNRQEFSLHDYIAHKSSDLERA